MSIEVELARRQWAEGHERFDTDVRGGREEELLGALEAVTDELRRRVGQTYSLDDLAHAYAVADTWVRDAVSEHAPFAGWPRYVTTVQDAAFHLYARGATDYVP
ncbi:MAG TPA: hypothetical protein VE444_04660 [Gaiellaceae bacterium]|jgi:hypothetical protein|nr:hypothetical protein [Gaiellaceae bacterium]